MLVHIAPLAIVYTKMKMRTNIRYFRAKFIQKFFSLLVKKQYLDNKCRFDVQFMIMAENT